MQLQQLPNETVTKWLTRLLDSRIHPNTEDFRKAASSDNTERKTAEEFAYDRHMEACNKAFDAARIRPYLRGKPERPHAA